MQVQLKVNGKAHSVDVPPNTLLVQVLRESLHLTGTHVGCDTAQCGACTVMMNGRAVKACNMLAAQAAGAEVTTIEGLAAAGEKAIVFFATYRCADIWQINEVGCTHVFTPEKTKN